MADKKQAETGFSFPTRDKPGWWEGWWTRSEVFQAVLREGIAYLGHDPSQEESLQISSVEAVDFLVWLMAGIRVTDPYTLLQAEFPHLARIEIETTKYSHRLAKGSLPQWLEPLDTYPADPIPPKQDLQLNMRPFKDSQEPLVLIYHTHTSEAFTGEVDNQSHAAEVFSQDSGKNIVRVGNELAWELQQSYNIPTAHLTDSFDYEGRSGAYLKSEQGVRSAMKKYPSAKILLDVHRDSVPRSATTGKVNDESYARVLFVLGTNRKLKHDNWRQNQAWMDAIAQKLDEKYPGLLRKLKDNDADEWTFARSDRYNQHLSPGAALVEIGGPENTMAEALRSVHAVADVLAVLIKAGRYPH